MGQLDDDGGGPRGQGVGGGGNKGRFGGLGGIGRQGGDLARAGGQRVGGRWVETGPRGGGGLNGGICKGGRIERGGSLTNKN